jgi:hypothetical protein
MWMNFISVQVTTHSHLLSHDELLGVENAVGITVSAFFLHEFDTELDFTNKIRYIWRFYIGGGSRGGSR